jgi:Protein of unknown function (DUF3887)
MNTAAIPLKPKMPLWQKMLVASAILLGALVFVALSSTVWQLHEANNAFDTFTGALIARNYAAAYQSTSSEFRAATNYDAFVKVHQGLVDRMGELKQVETTQSETNEHHDGWYGTVNADLIFAKGTLQFSFTLKKQNGAWKIYSYHEL